MKNKLIFIALSSVICASCSTNQISQESIEKVNTLEGRVKPGQVQLVFNAAANGFENAEIRQPGERTAVAGIGARSIALPTRKVSYIFTSDKDAGSAQDESISFRIEGAQAKLNLIVDLETNIDPSKSLGSPENSGILSYLQQHGGLGVEDYIKGLKFKNVLQKATQRSLIKMQANGKPLTQEEIVFDGATVAEFYTLIESEIQAVLTELSGVDQSPFAILVSPGSGAGGDKIELPDEVEQVYRNLAKSKAEAAATKEAVKAQQERNKLRLVEAQEATAELEAHKKAGTLDAYIELKKAEILSQSGALIIANPEQEIQVQAPKK